MKTLRTLLLAPLLLALAACGDTVAGEDAGDRSVRTKDAVTGVRWTVDSVTVDGKRTKAPARAYVEFEAGGRAGGNYGCNHFGAETSVEDGTVTVRPRESTGMACSGPVAAWEKTLRGTLTGRLTAEVTDGGLTLTARDGDRIALTAERPARLTGTTWTVNGLTDGEVQSSLPHGVPKKPHLRFGKDGSVRGDLGCNSFSGTAKVRDGRIDFGEAGLIMTKKACTGPAGELESELRGVLKGTVRYEVRHRTLTLTAEDGTGLSAAAR